jgi:UDP-N-acetylmuramoyl-tripeptide--D-alanyl-D-alanine ligase
MRISAFEVMDAVRGTLEQGSGEQIFSSVATDTRQLQPGALFFALKGERSDGHSFLLEAERRGAAGAMIKDLPEGCQTSLALIKVKDPLTALGKLGAWWRRKFDIPCVAITGSSGKTTTKEMAAKILNDRFPILANEENLNTEVGVPLTLFRLESHYQALVLEFGMRGKGQIALLAAMVKPKIGIITNVGSAHVGLLGSQEAIREAKLELAPFLTTRGCLVVPGDDPSLKQRALKETEEVVTFGLETENHFRATEVTAQGPEVCFTMHSGEENVKVRLPIPGAHNVLNALAATAATAQLGVSLSEAAASLNDFRLMKMRCQPIQTEAGITILNDAYNANPESTRAALRVLSLWPGDGQKVAVLGEMLELGDFAPQAHSQVGEEAARQGLDLIVAIGELGRTLIAGVKQTNGFSGEAHHYRTKQDAKKLLLRHIRPGAVVLVKGSRMTGMEEIVDALQHHHFGICPPSEKGPLPSAPQD